MFTSIEVAVQRRHRPPGDGRKAADLYAALLAAEPHATAERRRELRTEAARRARQSPLFFDSGSPGAIWRPG